MAHNAPALAPAPTAEADHAAERAEVSLRTFALAAVASLAPGGPETPEARFLLAHLDAVAPGRGPWEKALPGHLRRPSPADAPPPHLAGERGLTAAELLAVALAAAVEDDVMAGRAVAHLQAPVGGSRPTLGLLATALAGVAPASLRALEALLTGAALRGGLL